MAVRIAPSDYFANDMGTTNDNLPLIIFGGICVVAIVAIALAYSKR